MKNIFSVVYLLIALSSSCLLAQNFNITLTPTPTSNQSTNLAVHVGGGSNRFPIGSVDEPVTVDEYCMFLSATATTRYCYYNASHQLITIDYPTVNNYYDPVLMDPSSSQSCIVRSVFFSGPKVATSFGEYDYYAQDGDDVFIIDALNAEYAQTAFNAWRINHPPL